MDDFLKNYSPILLKEFEEFISLNDLKSGSNLLTLEVAKRYVKKFLEFENKQIKKALEQKQNYSVLEVEQSLDYQLILPIHGENIEIKIHGKVDRISKIGESIQLLDYKTGSVQSGDLKFKETKDLCTNPKKGKALQLLCYSWLYYQNNPQTTTIKPCIYSFKNGKEGFMPLLFENTELSKDLVLEIFPKIIEEILSNLLDKNTLFEHDNKSKYCEYCN